jgi:hypothetical protein
MKVADSLRVILQKTWRGAYWPRVQTKSFSQTMLHKYFYTRDRADEYSAKVVARFNRRFCHG